MDEPARVPQPVPEVEHTTVYRREDEFAAWPFNVGMWRTGSDDIVAAFIANDCDYSIESHLSHRRISTYGRIHAARSTDGGRSWEDDGKIADCVETSEEVYFGKDKQLSRVNLGDPDTLLTSWSAIDFYDPNAIPWVRISEDGGDTWSDPVGLPKFQFDRIQGRPSYLVRDDGTILLMLTGQADSDPHNRPIVYASFDGGEHWTFIAYITGSENYAMICPVPIQLASGRILASVRVNPTWDSLWTEVYASDDEGRTWSFLSRVNDHGAPATLLPFADDRVLCVYGYRRPSSGVRARISDDGGKTWGREWIVRDGGANADVGYPRAVKTDDDTVVTAYYYNQEEDAVPADGGVRHIEASRFRISELE